MLSIGFMDNEPPEQPEPLPVEPVAEPIVAWRAWRVFTEDGAQLDHTTIAALADAHDRGENPWRRMLLPKLGPVAHDGRWTDTTVRAVCQAGRSWRGYAQGVPSHDAPDPRCHCGWWGVREEEQIAAILAKYRSTAHNLDATLAYGRVQMWGRVIEHRDGYRAEYARPYDVIVIDGTPDIVAGLRDRYAIDVTAGPLPARVEEVERELAEQQKAATLDVSSFSQLIDAHMTQLRQAYSFPPISTYSQIALLKEASAPKRRWWLR